MEKMYRAKRHLKRKVRTSWLNRVPWSIVCILLVGTFLAVWSQSQALRSENKSLKRDLATAVIEKPVKTCKTTGNWKAGETRTLTVPTTFGERSYIVHVPANFTDGPYFPMMLFYVGRGATAAGGQSAYGLDQLPGIIVYPEPTMGAQGMTAWQGAPYSSSADDIAYTTAIINNLESSLCIDKTRIYAAGFSNGGGFTALLSCKLSDTFAAYAIIAGAMYPPESDCTPTRPTPLVSIHGDQDPTVPYTGSVPRKLPDVETWVTFRASADSCGQPTMSYPSPNIAQTTWAACKDNSVIQNVRIVGGGHAWGAVPNDVMWQFLAQFTR